MASKSLNANSTSHQSVDHRSTASGNGMGIMACKFSTRIVADEIYRFDKPPLAPYDSH
jgi:hypothetical protein